jgi:hypothetical protein
MNPGILDAKAELEADGLTVKLSGENSLWICETVQGADGVRLSNNASVLLREADRWIAIFPAAGMLSYEVPGELQDLVALIKSVYTSYRRSGGPLKDEFARSVPDPDLCLRGRPPAEDRPIPGSPTRPVEVSGRLRGKR